MAKCSDTERAYLDSLFTDEIARADLQDKVLAERISKKLRTDYGTAYLKLRIAEKDLNQARSAIYSICSDKKSLEATMVAIEKEADKI